MSSALDVTDYLREELHYEWDELEPEAREAASAACLDAVDLLARHLRGEDVDEPLEEVKAQVRCFKFAGASHVRRAIWRAVRRWGRRAGMLIEAIALGALAGLVEGDLSVGELLDGLAGGGGP